MSLKPQIRLRVLPALLPLNGRATEIRVNDDGVIQQRLRAGPDGIEAPWQDVIERSNLAGPPGPNTELRNNGSFIQTRVTGEENWTDLVAVQTLVGPPGADGPPGPPGDATTEDPTADFVQSYMDGKDDVL